MIKNFSVISKYKFVSPYVLLIGQIPQKKFTFSRSLETQGVITGEHCGKYMNCRV